MEIPISGGFHSHLRWHNYPLAGGLRSFLERHIHDDKERSRLMNRISAEWQVSKQTLRRYLCRYLVYQDIAALAPAVREKMEQELTPDQKNMRWALNKFFYTTKKSKLSDVYVKLLKEKYCDAEGNLLTEYPSMRQFRYFESKYRKQENYLISRNGLKNYQRNDRPLLGEGVQEYAPYIGVGMLDATVCDIYLVNKEGQIVGRPILVAGVDANTSLCLGYCLLWEGGVHSLQRLMLSIVSDKVERCRKMGISVKERQWPVSAFPGVMVTDMGSEYIGETFEQITEFGVTLINLPSFRPDLKGPIEKLFDMVQEKYKDALKGKGVIMPDFQERGAHDYRKDACLTLEEFERIVVRCIVYYNSERVISDYPYTDEMIQEQVRPYACDIWNWKLQEPGTNLIAATEKEIVLTLLPRTEGKFTRYGLMVNKLRYHRDGYKEEYLKGGKCTVAYNPDDVSSVWLRGDSGYEEFKLIDSLYAGNTLTQVSEMKQSQVYKAFIEEKRLWDKDFGRMYAHNVISFHKDESITPSQCLEIGENFADKFFLGHQSLIAVHQDKGHLHCHVVTNTVSAIDGRKLHQTKRDLEKQKQYINDLCQERGLSVPEKGRHFDGKEINDGDIRSWNKNTYNLLIDKEKPSFLADCALAVMDTLPLSANKEDFIKGMGSRGWSVRWENKRKHITFMDKKGHKIRDSNLAKTFSFYISKETLNREFERTTHDKAIHDRAISTAIARADSAVKNGRNEIRISRANRGTDGGTEDNSDPEGRKTKPCSG